MHYFFWWFSSFHAKCVRHFHQNALWYTVQKVLHGISFSQTLFSWNYLCKMFRYRWTCYDWFTLCLFSRFFYTEVNTMKICRWKWHWKITATLKFNITKENTALKIFQCYLSEIFSVSFVWHNEDDSEIGFSHNNIEPNRIIIGLNFQCDYNRFDVINEWFKIWNGI